MAARTLSRRGAAANVARSAAEADAMWEYAARTAADATARIRYCTATGNPAAAADAASAASDALHVAAAALGSRALRQAARQDRDTPTGLIERCSRSCV